ncbi:Extradiol ring-cleavage dioxygenase, class III enzyme, subunit B [Exidia glandulosa HHB12029]|uniref:Extradiol ring-cleavage dioxygenase, class III enzyme, subunit B n=1 Tax=Exidia glandulosa HHB12029 TaxID=1314781 RepID=A0A165D9R2_EXIGL|nr:Extradiol ring-cleavage dioxygenase, class III enzyme, subunit B [Exidia glandulosa HHB12029]
MTRPATREQWRKALDELPRSSKIPAFYFAHGQTSLVWPASAGPPRLQVDIQKPNGPLVQFLKDFGPALLSKYTPKAIVVFSAHWETSGEALGAYLKAFQLTDYGDEDGSNPMLYDYYGFPQPLYDEVKFSSRGNTTLSNRIVELLNKARIKARTSPKTEPRGRDGRGFDGAGLDHGVFVPFINMFSPTFNDIPIVQVSINASLELDDEWALGRALDSLRSDGVLILAGGVPVHSFRELAAFSESTARPIFKEWCETILKASEIQEPEARKAALYALPKHAGFRVSNPREEHFIPLYVAAGAGEQGGSKILCSLYGAPTIAFGIEA